MVMLDPVLKPDQPQPVALQALLKDWGIDAGNDIVLDVERHGLIGPTIGAGRGELSGACRLPTSFGLLTAYPLARSMTPVEGGVNGRTAQKLVRDRPQQLGRNQPQEPRRRRAGQDGRHRQEGADLARRRGVGAGGATPPAPPGAQEGRRDAEAGRDATRRVRRLGLRQQRRARRPGEPAISS